MQLADSGAAPNPQISKDVNFDQPLKIYALNPLIKAW
jgi:hypothetical protein